MKEFKLLGCKVTEKTTGFSGVVTSIALDLVGCIQAYITPPSKSKNQEGHWYDTARLIVGRRVMSAPKMATDPTGPSVKSPMP